MNQLENDQLIEDMGVIEQALKDAERTSNLELIFHHAEIFARLPLEYQGVYKQRIKITFGTTFRMRDFESAVRQYTFSPNGHINQQQHLALTESGNADRLINEHGKNIRFNHSSQKWHIWRGNYWEQDDKQEIEQMAEQIILDLYHLLPDIDNETERKKTARWIEQSLRYTNMKNYIKHAQHREGVAIINDDVNSDNWLFNCTNCTLDLKRHKILEHNPDMLITKIGNVEFDKKAEAPTWLQFLDRIFDNHKDIIPFIQKALGYSLTGDVSEQCLFFCYGTGSNGKSTFFETLQPLYGSYFQKAPATMLMSKRDLAIPNDVARLAGIRFVVTSELEGGQYFSEATLKDLTGGDRITARFMRAEWFEFTPTHKLWMYGNHKPVIKNLDEGIWRRLMLIPFTEYIGKKERDVKLLNKLRSELPGILNWILQGLKMWNNEGLNPPDAIVDAVEEYKSEMDIFSDFIAEMVIDDYNASIKCRDLYKAYCDWSITGKKMGNRAFYDMMRQRNYISKRGAQNVMIFPGIRLKTDLDQAAQDNIDTGKSIDDTPPF